LRVVPSDDCHAPGRIEVIDAQGEFVAVRQFARLDLPGRGADEVEQFRQLVFQLRKGVIHQGRVLLLVRHGGAPDGSTLLDPNTP
jgi:hypothetical protein